MAGKGGGATGLVQMMIYAEDKSVQHQLNRLQSAIGPVGLPAFLAGPMHKILDRRAERRFDSEGGSEVGGQWAPLKASTREIRSNMGYPPSGPINVRTHELEEYITGSPPDVQVGPGGGQLRYPGGRMTGELLEKVGTAQAGKVYPLTVPRPVLGMDHEDLTQGLVALSTWIAKGGA